MIRVRHTAQVLLVLTPMLWCFCVCGGIEEEMKGLISFIFGGFEIIYLLYYMLTQLIFKKREYMLIDVVRCSFWAVLIVYGLMLTFIGYFYNKDLSAYYVMLCALSMVALLSKKELIIYMSVQFVAITALCIFFSMNFFQWVMILFANITFFITSRKSRSAYAEVYTMENKVRRVSKSAEEDPLTGLMNRRGLDRVVEEAWNNNNGDTTVALVIMDIDYFKQYNDKFGHPQGDVCLKKISEIIARVASEARAFSARIGGEEFVLFLKDTNEAEVVLLAERIREGVEKMNLKQSPAAPREYVTISLGVAVGTCAVGNSFLELYAEADKALYKAKSSGKNITVYKNSFYRK